MRTQLKPHNKSAYQKVMAAWQDVKAEKERRDEEQRMARREVYMVEVVKRAYIPVYARNAEEARQLCDDHSFEPEDDWDAEWTLASEDGKGEAKTPMAPVGEA